MEPKGAGSEVESYVSGHSPKPVSSVKLLGVQIDERISFNDHISTPCAQDPVLLTWLTLILAWISNDIYYKVWDGISHPFLNFNGATVEV